jgi:hypothetical protein
MKKIIFLLISLLFILLFNSGCGPSAIAVRERPAPPVYVRPMAPSPAYFWVDGDWVRHGNGYVYRKGYWVKPRPGRRNYVPGHWQPKRQGWVWIRGHW